MTHDKTFYSSFNYFEALFNNSRENSVLIMDANGTITAVNKAFTDCFGYEEEDLIGKNTAVLFTKEDQENRLPEKELDQVQRTGQSNDNNYLVNKSGVITWVSGESILVKNNRGDCIVLKILQNIHQQKSDEISIRQLHDFNESILQSIKDVVMVIDDQMNIVKANDEFLNLFQSQIKQLSNLNFADILQPSDTNKHLYSSLENAIRTQKGFSNHEIEISTMNGNKRIFEITCTPLLDREDKNLLIILHDITVSKELEKEREDIIGFIIHELRNPVSNLKLSNEIMKEALTENKISLLNDMLARSENNVERMSKMIAGLYDGTKIYSGNFRLEMSEFNFGDMVKEAIETIEVLQPAFNVTVKGNGDFLVKGDRYRLIQVITNYLGNAIKYSNGNKEVIISVQREDDMVIVSVKDDGIGISQEHLPYVFQRFFRLEKARNIEGIGLGLYLCQQIIRAHKGRVWAESEVNKGSVFYFAIPVNAEISGNK